MSFNTATITIKKAWWLTHIYIPCMIFTLWFVRRYINPQADINHERVEKIVKLGTKAYLDGKRIS